MKKWLVLALTSMLLLSTVGCSSANTASNGSEKNVAKESGNKEEVTLDFLWFSDGNEGEVMQKLLDEYEEQNPHVTVNLVNLAYKDLVTKVKSMVAGGKPPALARITDPGQYVSQALDLGEYINVDSFKSQFNDSIESYYIEGDTMFAAPLDLTANGLIYNKTLFDEAGVAVPQTPDEVWTWEEYMGALRTVMEKTDAKYGMVMDYSGHRWATMLYQYGGSIINEDGTAIAINNEMGVQALDDFIALHKEGIIPESVWLGAENPNNLFRSGTVATHFSGSWILSNYKDITDFEWGVTYMPKGTIRSSVPGGKFLMSFKGSEHPEEVAKLVEYLTSQEVNGRYCQESLFISPRKDNSELDYEFGKEYFKVFADELAVTPGKAAYDWARQDIVGQFVVDIKREISQAISGSKTSKEALDAIAQMGTTVIESLK